MNCMKTHGIGILFRGTVLPEDLPAAVLQPALAVVMVF